MPATTPDEIHELFEKRFAAKDLDGLMELYEPNAIFLLQDGQIVSGTEAIRKIVSGFLAGAETFELDHGSAVQTDGVALLQHGWTLKGADPDGNRIEMTDRTAGVVRRQPEGTWLIAIDNPWSTGEATHA
jgi:uncharacterized protein (TIGR02246 family)